MSSFSTLARERTFIKTHSIESRCVIGLENILFAGVIGLENILFAAVIGLENILFAGASMQLSAWKYYGLGSEGVKGAHRVVVVVVYCCC